MDKPIKLCLYLNAHRLGVLRKFNAKNPLIMRRATVDGTYAYTVEESTTPGLIYRLIDAWEESELGGNL